MLALQLQWPSKMLLSLLCILGDIHGCLGVHCNLVVAFMSPAELALKIGRIGKIGLTEMESSNRETKKEFVYHQALPCC